MLIRTKWVHGKDPKLAIAIIALSMAACALDSGADLDHPSILLVPNGLVSETIAVDATHVYWVNPTSEGGIWKAPIMGGSPTKLAATALGFSPRSLAVDATHVYWTTGGSFAPRKVPIVGGETTSLPTETGEGGGGIVLQGRNLYWTSMGLPGSSTRGAIMTASVDDGMAIPIVSGDEVVGGSPGAIAVDAARVYWTYESSIIGQAKVMAALLEGGPTTTLVSGGEGSFGIAIDSTNVYWTDRFAGKVTSVPLEGGSPTTLAAEQTFVNAIASDGTNVYWVTAKALMKMPVRGGTAIALKSGVKSANSGIALDATNVYWSTSSGMMKTAK